LITQNQGKSIRNPIQLNESVTLNVLFTNNKVRNREQYERSKIEVAKNLFLENENKKQKKNVYNCPLFENVNLTNAIKEIIFSDEEIEESERTSLQNTRFTVQNVQLPTNYCTKLIFEFFKTVQDTYVLNGFNHLKISLNQIADDLIFPVATKLFEFNWKTFNSNEFLLKKSRHESLFYTTNVTNDSNLLFRIVSHQLFGHEKYFRLVNLYALTEYVFNSEIYDDVMTSKNINPRYFLHSLFNPFWQKVGLPAENFSLVKNV
jgi:hypothetical protein